MFGYSDFHRRFIWPYIEKRRKRNSYTLLNYLKESEKKSRYELESYQWERIIKIIKHAYKNTAFYRNKFDELNMKPADIKSIKDFKLISPVTRRDLNSQLGSMTAQNIREIERHSSTTGGSTGVATRFIRDNACLAIKKASEYRFNTWAGWMPGEKILAYWPALTDFNGPQNKGGYINPLLLNRYIKLFAGQLNEKILSEHVMAFNKFRPHLVRAFPSALEQFAMFVEGSGLSIPQPKAVICVGEPLLESQRAIFKKVFGCDVYNCYVSRECGNIACECSFHSGLHVAEELIYLEIDNPNTGEVGEIFLTDLWNMGMPLIRYKIQDAAKWEVGDCHCGKPHKKIGVNAARLSAFLISPVDGSYVSGSTLTHYLLAEGPQVGRVKLVQDANDHISVLMTGDEKSNRKSVEHIKTRLNVIFKGKMKLNFEYVDKIPLLNSGKYSFVERKF
jgi:phenylacetate-coenzyme A ligase PaaK-like adenylate-forming protein